MKKTLVITGGSRGIGLATIERFAREGFAVINLSRSEPPFQPLTHLSVDLSNIDWPQHHGSQLQALLADSEQIVLVHNAALLEKDASDSVDAQQFQRVMQLNVIAAGQLNTLVIPLMKGGSSIIYVSSTLGEKAVPGTCSYVTSKHAQIGLMRSTCQDLFGRGIHTVAICPGFTDTEMLRDHVGHDQQILSHFATQNAYNRLLRPEEIADTVAFCADSPALNGSVIHANLGQAEH